MSTIAPDPLPSIFAERICIDTTDLYTFFATVAQSGALPPLIIALPFPPVTALEPNPEREPDCGKDMSPLLIAKSVITTHMIAETAAEIIATIT